MRRVAVVAVVAAATVALAACGNGEAPPERAPAPSEDFPPTAELLQILPTALAVDLGRELGCVVSPTRKGPLRVIVRSTEAVRAAQATLDRLEARELADVVVDPSAQPLLDRGKLVRRIERDAPSGVLVEELTVLGRRACPLIEIGIPPRERSSRRIERWARAVKRRHGRLVVVHRVQIESKPGAPRHPIPADEG